MASDAGNFGIYLAVSYDVIAATNSSPQTTEINAKARGKTLMKWVWIGIIQAGIFGIVGAIMAKREGDRAWPPFFGALIGLLALWAQYAHALKAGMESTEAPTETYGPTTVRRR